MFDDPFEEFEEFFDTASQKMFASTFYRPPMDIIETKEKYVITVEIPGLAKENIKLVLEGNILKIEGFRPRDPVCDEENTNASFVHSEIHYGHFKRRVEFPNGIIDADAIQSRYTNGFLIIEIPKKQPKEIEIQLED